ncbi:MAG TPA: pilin [Patescibacteria group bacterium]|nr:pilin [Patescibacteria group bacterium]
MLLIFSFTITAKADPILCSIVGYTGQQCCDYNSSDPVCISYKNPQNSSSGSLITPPNINVNNSNVDSITPPQTIQNQTNNANNLQPNSSWCNNDPNLVYSNGVCLPANNPFPTTGIASSNSISSLLIKIIQLLLTLAGIIAVVILVVGGYWYITSAGNEEQAEKGQKAITNAIIGLVVIMLAYAIVTIISQTVISTQYT